MKQVNNTTQLIIYLSILLLSCSQEWYQKKFDKKAKKNYPAKNPLKYKEGTLGYDLNRLYSKFSAPVGSNGHYDSLLLIPDEVLGSIDEGKLQLKTEEADTDGKGLFFYVLSRDNALTTFDNLNFTLLQSQRIQRSIYSTYNYVVDDAVADMDRLFVSHSEYGYMAAKIRSQVTPPYSELKAAAETSKTSTKHMLFLTGTFNSPIQGVVHQNADLYLQLWKVYSLNTTLTDEAYVLKTFSGLIGKTSIDQNSKKHLEASAALDVKVVPSVSVAGSYVGEKSVNATILSNNLQTHIITELWGDGDERLAYFERVPSMTEIQTSFSNIQYYPWDIPPYIPDGVEGHLSLFFKGIPENLANNSANWNITCTSGNIRVSSPVVFNTQYLPGREGQQAGMIVSLDYNPTSNAFGDNDRAMLSYDLVFNNTINKNGTIHKLKKSFNVEITKSNEPTLIPVGSMPFTEQFIDDNQLFYPEWHIAYSIADENDVKIIKTTPPIISNFVIKDHNGTVLTERFVKNINYRENDIYLNIQMNTSQRPKPKIFKLNMLSEAKENYTVSFDIQISAELTADESSLTVNRSLETVLLYPKELVEDKKIISVGSKEILQSIESQVLEEGDDN